MASKGPLIAKHTNGAPDTTAVDRKTMAAQMIRLYGNDVYLEYFPDRGLVWMTEADSVDDDGSRAVASVHELELIPGKVTMTRAGRARLNEE